MPVLESSSVFRPCPIRILAVGNAIIVMIPREIANAVSILIDKKRTHLEPGLDSLLNGVLGLGLRLFISHGKTYAQDQ